MKTAILSLSNNLGELTIPVVHPFDIRSGVKKTEKLNVQSLPHC